MKTKKEIEGFLDELVVIRSRMSPSRGTALLDERIQALSWVLEHPNAKALIPSDSWIKSMELYP